MLIITAEELIVGKHKTFLSKQGGMIYTYLIPNSLMSQIQ